MNFRFLPLLFCIFLLVGCDSDEVEEETVTVAFPITMSLDAFRSSVAIESPKPIVEAGKIYAYQDLIFINDDFKGIHIIDNTDPSSPLPLSYIKIVGNVDISIKNDFLYADSSVDLLVFDISEINSIKLLERLENVFPIYDFHIPAESQYAEWGDFDYGNEVIVGWELREMPKEDYEFLDFETFDFANSDSGGAVGQGGSLARFQIVEDYLYTVGPDYMNIFNITNLAQPNLVNQQYAGWAIETMFHADGYLYLGGERGMYIYGIEDPSAPNYISEFTHWEGCDPVVVDGDYAYLTLRGGNLCGQDESVLEVIDISDKSNPTLAYRYVMENPYGLGFKGNDLFVCDGNAGLKLLDKSNPTEIKFIKEFDDIFAKDVIPLEDVLLMIGDEILYQYKYQNQDLELLSVLDLN